MSKVVKGIGKVFKKVAKVVKKIAPYALMAAAVIYTGGAAMGASWAAGGWGAAVTKGLSALQIPTSGALGNIITGAVTQAGYGAAIGGTLSAATGGSFSKGAQAGALTGAVTGGLMGGMGMQTDPLKGVFDKAPTSSVPQVTGTTGNAYANPAGTAVSMPPGSGVAPPLSTPTTASRGLFADGSFLGKDGWLQNNQTLAGNVVKGVGAGLLAGDDARDTLREKQRIAAENYGTSNPGSNYRRASGGFISYEYAFNPRTGRIERTPIGG